MYKNKCVDCKIEKNSEKKKEIEKNVKKNSKKWLTFRNTADIITNVAERER